MAVKFQVQATLKLELYHHKNSACFRSSLQRALVSGKVEMRLLCSHEDDRRDTPNSNTESSVACEIQAGKRREKGSPRASYIKGAPMRI